MAETVDIRVPDLGDFKSVEVIEVHVRAGDAIVPEQPLITLESDKATMEVPATAAGRLVEVCVKPGDQVSAGTVLGRMTPAEPTTATAPAAAKPKPERAVAAAATPPRAAAPLPGAGGYDGPVDLEADLVVLGAGPGGYTAAFRAADLGLAVTLVERWPTLGGVCLNVGCIPSKALLHAARVIEEAREMADHGVEFGAPVIRADRLREWKNKVVGRLTGGLDQLARQRRVRIVRGSGRFLSPHHLEVTDGDSRQVLSFRQCIIAAGSESVRLPGLPDDPRIIDSTSALELELPASLLVVGGGIIGLEMATVYEALGVRVSVVELLDQLMPGVDADLLRPLERRLRKRYEAVMTGTKVAGMAPAAEGIEVTFERAGKTEQRTYGKVLVAVGRSPNGARIDAARAGVTVTERGFVPVDRQQRTNVAHIFAIGDIVGQPMLAHKASHEGKVAAEVAAGHKRAFDARVIPAVAYTDPEIAWVGLTETRAKAEGIAVDKGVFPWAASGRALALGRDEGLTKLLFDPVTRRVLGAGIVGPNAGDLISEVALAIEMGCDAEDIGLTIHPHPTLSETVAFAAEAFDGTLTDLYLPKKR
ncbi:MAG: dihydrolipoyl dehydrogenase [Gammaproteobacteria bacterium]|nr:dihydrolipoyl dehydrogenase [Gammaproteobacteria bacterium]